MGLVRIATHVPAAQTRWQVDRYLAREFRDHHRHGTPQGVPLPAGYPEGDSELLGPCCQRRSRTAIIAFMPEAIAVFLLLQFISKPVWFILLSGLAFFAWGEIFSLFPAITGDLFGKTWATTNYGIGYTAKGVASIFAGPVAALASAKTGSWVPIFWVMIACDVVAAFMALLWLKPLAAKTIQRQRDEIARREAAVQVRRDAA